MAVSDTRIATRTKALYEAANPGVVIDLSKVGNILPYLAKAIAEEILSAQVKTGQTVTGTVTVPSLGTFPLDNGQTTTKGDLE